MTEWLGVGIPRLLPEVDSGGQRWQRILAGLTTMSGRPEPMPIAQTRGAFGGRSGRCGRGGGPRADTSPAAT
jgi:hypothetical protein